MSLLVLASFEHFHVLDNRNLMHRPCRLPNASAEPRTAVA
jgi:hypothetical protein